MTEPYIHPSADVSPKAKIGENTRVWHQVQIREGAKIGENCILGKGVYVDFDVVIGRNVKIQNGCFVFHGAALEDGVFLGPGVILTNDKNPRAINPDGSLKKDNDWEVGKTLIKRGASLGAGSIILPGVTVGEFAMAGAGAVVTKDVPPHALVVGTPARLIGFVCDCGARLGKGKKTGAVINAVCPKCAKIIPIPNALYKSSLFHPHLTSPVEGEE
jgi:UDP-2-acetamido-3-amino-2,3-dideoxy-glucuronate N-acetyltransferase